MMRLNLLILLTYIVISGTLLLMSLVIGTCLRLSVSVLKDTVQSRFLYLSTWTTGLFRNNLVLLSAYIIASSRWTCLQQPGDLCYTSRVKTLQYEHRVEVWGRNTFSAWRLLFKHLSLLWQARIHTVISFLIENLGTVHKLRSTGEGLINASSHPNSRKSICFSLLLVC